MFFDNNGNQRKWLVIFGIFAPLLISAIFSIWGIKLTIESDKDRKQVEELTRLVKESQKNFDVLQKIYIASDSTSKSTMNLKQLPKKFSELSSTLDVLNGTLRKETEKIGKSYDALNENYPSLINQQKSYLDNISRITKLTNETIGALKKNNEAIDAEFSRRPNIEITCLIKKIDDKFYLNEVYYNNFGNIECVVESLKIKLSNNSVCKETGDENIFDFKKLDTRKYVLLHNDFTDMKALVNTVHINDFENRCYFTNKDIEIEYTFSYTSKYQSNVLFGKAILKFE
jgi:hypothetical protein